MVNFSWRQRRHFFIFCCRQVLVLVSPRWLWEICLCFLVAICKRIRRCWMRSSCIWKKDYGCGFFVLWRPPLHRCNVWRSCLFLLWHCIWCFYTGIYLVGGMCFWPYNCIISWEREREREREREYLVLIYLVYWGLSRIIWGKSVEVFFFFFFFFWLVIVALVDYF